VLQRRPQKEEGTCSRMPTFVCMSKINHWGVGITKLRDDIVENACDSHTAPFSKMADINAKTHNEVIQNVKSMANPHFQGQGMQWGYQKCPRVNVLQDNHWQDAGNSSSKPGKPALS